MMALPRSPDAEAISRITRGEAAPDFATLIRATFAARFWVMKCQLEKRAIICRAIRAMD
jgi:hypothetical protein